MNQVQLLSKILKDQLVQNFEEFNTENKNQQKRLSAVTIILRNTRKIDIDPKADHFRKIQAQTNYLIDTEILLLRRADHSRSHAGQICLPGGKVQHGETVLEAAIRQTYQQTGLVLKQSELVGITSQKFQAMFRGDNILHYAISSIFFVSERSQINLSKQEMSEYNWLPLRYFMTDAIYKPLLLDMSYLKTVIVNFERYQNIKYMQWAAIDVGMKKNLFGLTLYILCYFANGFVPTLNRSLNLLQIQAKNEPNQTKRVEIEKIIQSLQERLQYLIKFKEEYFHQYPVILNQEKDMGQQEKKHIKQSYSLFMKNYFFLRPRL